MSRSKSLVGWKRVVREVRLSSERKRRRGAVGSRLRLDWLEERAVPSTLYDEAVSGDLSNDQAAELTSSIAACSGDAFPTHLIQLHLSRECNRPQLAARAGQAAIENYSPNAGLITARQDAAAKSIPLARHANSERRSAPRTRPVPPPPRRGSVQRALPGLSG